MFALLHSYNLKIYTLQSFLSDALPLNQSQFCEHFQTNSEYYFVAANAK
jgi:hypothetical protein